MERENAKVAKRLAAAERERVMDLVKAIAPRASVHHLRQGFVMLAISCRPPEALVGRAFFCFASAEKRCTLSSYQPWTRQALGD